jgi:hypothetical protein
MGKASIQSAFKPGTDKKIIKARGALSEAILSKSTANGSWLYKHFDGNSTAKNEVYIYLRGVLSKQCIDNSDLTSALLMAVLNKDTCPVDASFLQSVLTTNISSEQNQVVEKPTFVWLIDAFNNPEKVLAKLLERNLDSAAGWIRKEGFSASGNEKRMTQIEKKVQRIQLFCLLSCVGSVATKKSMEQAIFTAWNLSPKSFYTQHRDFVKEIVTTDSIEYGVNRRRATTLPHTNNDSFVPQGI